VRRNLEQGEYARGASTITQQLAKNVFLSTEKSLNRKLKEAILAYRLEQALSKNRILEVYLNVIEWGDGVYGIEAAARTYFGKSAAYLDPAEAAFLAAMIPNPRQLNPATRFDSVKRGQERILVWMSRLPHRGGARGGKGQRAPPENKRPHLGNVLLIPTS
jgi:monofunctional biosynthetic peptidoglycan transglycosylase